MDRMTVRQSVMHRCGYPHIINYFSDPFYTQYILRIITVKSMMLGGFIGYSGGNIILP